jgi:hypothetical protein
MIASVSRGVNASRDVVAIRETPDPRLGRFTFVTRPRAAVEPNLIQIGEFASGISHRVGVFLLARGKGRAKYSMNAG